VSAGSVTNTCSVVTLVISQLCAIQEELNHLNVERTMGMYSSAKYLDFYCFSITCTFLHNSEKGRNVKVIAAFCQSHAKM
jgi:hypothetical protein